MLGSVLLFLTISCTTNNRPRIVSYAVKNDAVSNVYKVQVNGRELPVTVVPNVDSTEAVRIENEYYKLPEYCWLESKYMTLHYVYFAIDSTPKIEIDASQPIKEFTIYPKRLHIKGAVDQSKLSFTVPMQKKHHIVVRINNLPIFVVLAEPVEEEIIISDDSKIVSLNDFIGGKRNIEDYTNIFIKVIAKLNESGKTLYIPKGDYLSDEIKIKNCKNFNIYLEAGAIIRTKIDTEGNNIQRRGIWIDSCENITISGYGVLDHQAYENFIAGDNSYNYGFQGYDSYSKFENVKEVEPFIYSPVFVSYSKNIKLKDFVVRNGRVFNVNVRHSDNIVLENLKVLTPAGSSPEWNDGIVVGSVQNILIDDCFVYANDDPFSSGHNLLPYDNRTSKNILVRNSFLWNPRANGVRLGWALNTYFGDIIFQNCDFGGNNNSSFIIHKQQGNSSLSFSMIRFENCTFDDVALYKRPLFWVTGARIKNLELVNVHFDAEPKVKAKIIGDSIGGIDTLLIQNVTIGGIKVTEKNVDFKMENIKHLFLK